MSRTKTILKGTVILTITGIITRIMGFFYRIFLSRILGESGIGIYQLIFPVYAFGFSLTSAGIEIALSRLVASYHAKGFKHKTKDLLCSSIIITLPISVLFTLILQKYANNISIYYLHNTQTTELLLILSYIFPLTAIHSCIIGYYLGLKNTKTPSISQIIEQSLRISSVFFIFKLSKLFHFNFSLSFTVIGLIIGEFVSVLYCINAISKNKFKLVFSKRPISSYLTTIKELLSLSFPLTSSRVMLNLLQCIEAISIPLSLQKYGVTTSQSLSIYGVLTGMALPCILFPSAITNALSTMLLPTISEIHAIKDFNNITQLIKKSILSCSLLGFVCCIFFISFGNIIGNLVFNSTLSGKFIKTLAWMCPFLYTNNTLLSMINGIGKSWISFFINAVSLLIRIFSIMILIPAHGIYGYLCGLLVSQSIVFTLCLSYLYKHFKAEVF